MSDKIGVIHIHIGVDSVFEGALRRLFVSDILRVPGKDVGFFSEAMYKKHLRGAVDGGYMVSTNEAFDGFDFATCELVVSRPRFLFSGEAMNTEKGVLKAAYKIGSIQAALSEFHIKFHLFIVDHLTYLFGLKNTGTSLVPNSIISWLPLIEHIEKSLLPGNEISIKNAENPVIFYDGLLSEMFGFPTAERRMLCDRFIKTLQPASETSTEERATSAGWSIDYLDDCYTQDILMLNDFGLIS